MKSRVSISRKVVTTIRVVNKKETFHFRPKSVFKSFSKRSKNRFSKIGDFLRSYLTRHDALPAWFLTLTLHYQNKTDRESNKIFSYFLNYMRKKGIIKSYFWRAETQKRGAIHWHVIFVSELNDKDNLTQTLWYYWQKCNTKDAGYPADFIKIDTLTSGGAAYYVSKYVAKVGSSRPLTSRTCGISKDFSQIAKPFTHENYNDFEASQIAHYPNSVVSVGFDYNVVQNVIFDIHCDYYRHGVSDCITARLVDYSYLQGRITLSQYRENRYRMSCMSTLYNFFSEFFRIYLESCGTLP